MENREIINGLKYIKSWKCNGDAQMYEIISNAISALEKQEQTNAQSVNSMRTSRPNALESLNILEQAKDDKGCVPMSLVRQAFRNVMEQDKWIPVTERLPKEDCECRVTEGDFKYVFDCYWNNHKKQFEVWSYYQDGYLPITNVTAWKLKEAPYTEEKHEQN